MVPVSDYLNTSVLQSCYYQQLGLSYTLNKYSQAFTDLQSTCGALDTNWDHSQNCDDFVIYDVQLNLCKVVLNTAVTESVRTLATTSGWDVDMTHYDYRQQEIADGINDSIYSYQEKKTHSLDKVFIVIQPEAFHEDSALKPKYEFTTGASSAKNRLIEETPTRSVINAQYDGISEISFTYLNQELIYNNDVIRIIPGDLTNVKQLLQDCYYSNETNILRRDYEGIDEYKHYIACQPSFLLGFDFRKMKGACKQGLDIQQSDLFIRMKFAGATHPRIRVSYLFCCGGQIHIGGGKTSFLST
jgi:hypothetical protein